MNILIKNILSELVNKDGSRISGDEKYNQDDSMTTSPTSPPVTTDDYVQSTRQGVSKYMFRSFGEEDGSNSDVELPEDEKDGKKSKKKSKKKPKNNLKERLKVESKQKMGSIIEDIFTKNSFDKDMVSRYADNQVRMNGIPDLETIRETNPILIRKVAALKDIVEKNNSTGIEKAIILNYLLNLDMTDVPVEYKSELKKKIR
tara:strand:+ start:726 stop:1331 length:606 start_codon:yes stop_codon:yes gene_type:complete